MTATESARVDLTVATMGKIAMLLDETAGSSLTGERRELADAFQNAYEDAEATPGAGVSIRFVLI